MPIIRKKSRSRKTRSRKIRQKGGLAQYSRGYALPEPEIPPFPKSRNQARTKSKKTKKRPKTKSSRKTKSKKK